MTDKIGSTEGREKLSRRRAIALCSTIWAGCIIGVHPLRATTSKLFSSNRLIVRQVGTRNDAGIDVLLIPGLASGPAVWSSLIDRLKGHRLHLIYVAGFAGTGAGANAHGALLDPLTSELKRYIIESQLTRTAVIGHSMGGTLAMKLALDRNARVERAMVVDMLPDGSAMLGGTSEGLGYLAAQLNGYFTGTKAGRQLLAELVRQTPAGRDNDPNVIARALTELAQTDLTPRLGALTCPLSVVHALPSNGEAATALNERYRRAYASVPDARITGIGPSGHMVMLDQPDQFLRAVRQFLA